jgi:arabinose-5-phosphate isomerase
MVASQPVMLPGECLRAARRVLEAEAEALRVAAGRLDGSLQSAVELILAGSGRVVVTGMGKSGHIARKIAATLCSTGTPAVFLHPAEACHGDLGIYCAGDVTILISKNGSTAELLHLIPSLRGLGSALIGIVGNLNSPLARDVDVVLDARVSREADTLDLAPTCSSTVALGLGDALAVALMQARRFAASDFARFHPDGQLGRNLTQRVKSVMHPRPQTAVVRRSDPLRDVLIAMTRYPLGAACVMDAEDRLAGIITDGDIRRSLQHHDDIRELTAATVMTARPVTIGPEASLREAAILMEERPSQISVLPVLDERGVFRGLFRIHDLYKGSRRI